MLKTGLTTVATTYTNLETALGLTFRRVRSNLDNVAEFAKTVPYVPDRIRFDVARAELLKLLIGPLYGDDPSYGVRELMQNSIDAVREYDQFVLDNPQYKDVPRREQEADVVVELGPLDEATGYAVMTISDRGIGMTEATIRDYFLRAGASYRQSAEWKNTFEENRAEIKSKVLRSGRFGVGVLAAFLIGKEIEVETRHIVHSKGYYFSANLNVESISISNKHEAFVGTQIKIRVSADAYRKLLKSNDRVIKPAYWDWFCLDYPSIQRIMPIAKQERVSVSASYSFKEDLLSDGWHKLSSQEPYEIYWCYNEVPKLICNGIFVTNSSTVVPVSINYVPRPIGSINLIHYPKVSIIDRDGFLPLNLQRNALRTAEYPFGFVLIRDVLTEMLAYILFSGPESLNSQLIPGISMMPWMSISNNIFVVCKYGYGIQCAILLDKLQVDNVVQYINNKFEINIHLNNTLIFGGSTKTSKRNPLVNFIITSNGDDNIKNNICETRYISYEVIANSKLKVLQKSQVGLWKLFATENCPESAFNVEYWPDYKVDEVTIYNRVSIEEIFYPAGTYIKVISKPWLLDELWLEYFGREWIPFDLKERLAKFPETAKFFAWRYPQVVPDEAWALLGGKPTN